MGVISLQVQGQGISYDQNALIEMLYFQCSYLMKSDDDGRELSGKELN